MEEYEGSVCKWKLAFLKMALPSKATLRSVATLIFDRRVGCRFLFILLAVATLVIRRIFHNDILWDVKYSRAFAAIAWTCLSFSVFLGLLNMLERAIGINSIGCKVFEIVMSVTAVALWSLSIVLIVLYNVKYYEGYPKSYNIIQSTLCALSLFLQ
ncbi:uncharacterized protein LOC142358085, partial [Convolutriloba macropyga]|uniref:uncharacterized protein LOC142358085 n=1 Tax=Convolutriloba macropyga TaxID=536237 RepID=UPI003F522B2B